MGQVNSIIAEKLFINTMYMMSYPSGDGTSMCCIVACECAMGRICNWVVLCQPNRSTINGMWCFTNMDKGIMEMDFCGNPVISVMIDDHDDTIEKVRNPEYKGGLIIANLVLLWVSIEDQLVSHRYINAFTWQTRNRVLQMQLPEFGDIVKSIIWVVLASSYYLWGISSLPIEPMA